MGRLREIQEQMLELLEEAKGIVSGKRKTHRMTYERMKAYWHGHIQMGLTSEHDYIGGDGATMEEAVNEIEGDGDSLDDLVNYAGERVDAQDLALEWGYEKDTFPPGPEVEDVIKYAMEEDGMEPDTIRDDIDKVVGKKED